MKRHLPPLNALKSFEAAARHCSFREASIELNVSQSAVSHQIKNLEAILGVDLFIRTVRAVELTLIGRSYYPVLKDAFDKISIGTKVILAPLDENILTIQMYSTFTVRWLMPRLQKFQDAYPSVQVRIITSQSNVDFSEQGIDLGIFIGQRRQDDTHFEYLFTPKLLAVCSPAYLEKARASGPGLNRPSDLSRHTILQVYPSEKDWGIWLDATKASKVDPNSGQRFDSYDHALKAAVRGLGVGLAMQPYIAEDFEFGHLVDIFPSHHVRMIGHWYLVRPKDRSLTKKIAAFQDWLLSEVREDPFLKPLIYPLNIT